MRDTPNTTALLIEYGFIDNPNDVVKLQNNLTDYAEAVVRAVSNYIGVDYIAPDGTVVDGNSYKVKPGDTLYSIASLYGINVNDLKTYNNLTSNTLSIGQILKIPNNSLDNNEDNNNNNSSNEYIVVVGDNLYNIASKYGVNVVDIINLNNLTSTVLTPGQVLLIPSDNPNYTTYVVKSGDTLYGISSSYGINVDKIKELNNLNSNFLSIGQELLIPTDKVITETNYEVYTVESGDTFFMGNNGYYEKIYKK